jgi:glycosyltransferase involved in cell wall biosynthesis
MQRIALISENLALPLDEGFKKAAAEIAGALAAIGRDVTVFTPEPGALGLETIRLPRNKLLLGTAFGRRLRELAPDVVLYIPQSAATAMSLVRAALLKSQSGGLPVVVMSLQRRSHPASVRPLLKMLGRPDLVMVLSRVSLATMRHSGLKAVRVPLGVDPDRFSPPGPGEGARLRAKHALGDSEFILHIGHISSRRNLNVLRRVAEAGRHVLIVTSTSTRQDPRVAQVLHHPNIMLINRYVEDINEIYRLAQGYIFPTFSQMGAIEIPLSILEAMASNLAVVTTPFGGIPDLFEPGGGLSICRTDDELIKQAMQITDLKTVSTRESVLPLSWKHVARTMLETMETELR